MIPGRKAALMAIYEFYQKTGVALISKGVNGFGSFSECDDPGYFLYVPFFSSCLGVSVLTGAQWFSYLLSSILSFSLITLSFPFSFSWKNFFSIALSVFLGLKLSNICDVYIASAAAFIGVPIVLIGYRIKSSKLLYLGFLIVGLLGGFCDLIRSYSSLAPFSIIFILLIFNNFFSKKQKSIAIILLVIGYNGINFHYQSVLKQRDAFLVSQNAPSIKPSSHVFWHNMYIGFGFTRNNYGIRWDDSCASDAIQKFDPSCFVGTKEGEKITRTLIFNLYRKDRHFFLQSLFARFGVVIMFFLLWFGWVGLICSYFFPKPWYEEIAFIIGLGVSALPGVLTVPCFQYLTGFITCTVLYVIYSFSYISKKHRKSI